MNFESFKTFGKHVAPYWLTDLERFANIFKDIEADYRLITIDSGEKEIQLMARNNKVVYFLFDKEEKYTGVYSL